MLYQPALDEDDHFFYYDEDGRERGLCDMEWLTPR